MGITAERIYNNKTGKRDKETPESRAYKLATMHNKILRMIENVCDAKSYIQCKNSISSFESEAGKNSLDVVKLNGKLTDRIKVVTQETQASIDKLNAEIERIKNEKFEEPVEVLQELNAQAEHKVLKFVVQMGTNNDGNAGNRRRVGNWTTKADRTDALALIKMASLPQYAECFTSKQKKILLEKSKNPAEVIWEENKQPLLEEKNRQLGHEYLKAMNIRNVQKQISNTENNYYFKESEV